MPVTCFEINAPSQTTLWGIIKQEQESSEKQEVKRRKGDALSLDRISLGMGKRAC
jgi:hypothetical protein